MGVYGRCDPLLPRGPRIGEPRREQAPTAYAPAMTLQSTPICQSAKHVSRKTTGDPATHGGAGDSETGRWWDTDEATREEGPVQASAFALHDVTDWGAE